MKQNFTIKVTKLTLLVAGFAGVSSILMAAVKPESEPVSELLASAERESYAVSVDASTLDSYLREPDLDWRTHAEELNQMRDDINQTAKTVVELNDSRLRAAPWQVAAIDRIIPLMKEIAANTTDAIEFLNKYQSRLNEPKYEDYVEASSDVATQLADLVASYVDYGSSKTRYESLRRTLELPAR